MPLSTENIPTRSLPTGMTSYESCVGNPDVQKASRRAQRNIAFFVNSWGEAYTINGKSQLIHLVYRRPNQASPLASAQSSLGCKTGFQQPKKNPPFQGQNSLFNRSVSIANVVHFIKYILRAKAQRIQKCVTRQSTHT